MRGSGPTKSPGAWLGGAAAGNGLRLRRAHCLTQPCRPPLPACLPASSPQVPAAAAPLAPSEHRPPGPRSTHSLGWALLALPVPVCGAGGGMTGSRGLLSYPLNISPHRLFSGGRPCLYLTGAPSPGPTCRPLHPSRGGRCLCWEAHPGRWPWGPVGAAPSCLTLAAGGLGACMRGGLCGPAVGLRWGPLGGRLHLVTALRLLGREAGTLCPSCRLLSLCGDTGQLWVTSSPSVRTRAPPARAPGHCRGPAPRQVSASTGRPVAGTGASGTSAWARPGWCWRGASHPAPQWALVGLAPHLDCRVPDPVPPTPPASRNKWQ